MMTAAEMGSIRVRISCKVKLASEELLLPHSRAFMPNKEEKNDSGSWGEWYISVLFLPRGERAVPYKDDGENGKDHNGSALTRGHLG